MLSRVCDNDERYQFPTAGGGATGIPRASGKRARRARRVYDTPTDDKRFEVGVMGEHVRTACFVERDIK